MNYKDKMFSELNSVLVKFWRSQGRPDKNVRIELLKRMLHWYENEGIVVLDKQVESPKEKQATQELTEFEGFAVGDKVRIVQCDKHRQNVGYIYNNQIGVVRHIWDIERNRFGNIHVMLDNGCNNVFYPTELEKVGESD